MEHPFAVLIFCQITALFEQNTMLFAAFKRIPAISIGANSAIHPMQHKDLQHILNHLQSL
jgi:hypothetical protein